MGKAHSGDGHSDGRLVVTGARADGKRIDVAERQEGRRLGDRDVRNLGGRQGPTYSVQTTHLKPGTLDHAGKAWSTYGGRVGVWRIIKLLDRLRSSGKLL